MSISTIAPAALTYIIKENILELSSSIDVTQISHKVPSYDDVVSQIIDRDYEDIERDIFGFTAIECLLLNPETQAAFSQGNPFLRKAKKLGDMLREYKGIYSV